MKETTNERAVEAVEVTQADREAVAALIRLCAHSTMKEAAEKLAAPTLEGHADHSSMVQAFARHRITSVAAARPLLFAEAAGIAGEAIVMLSLCGPEVVPFTRQDRAVDEAREQIAAAIRTAGSKTDD